MQADVIHSSTLLIRGLDELLQECEQNLISETSVDGDLEHWEGFISKADDLAVLLNDFLAGLIPLSLQLQHCIV